MLKIAAIDSEMEARSKGICFLNSGRDCQSALQKQMALIYTSINNT